MEPKIGQIWRCRRTMKRYYIYNIWPITMLNKMCVIFHPCRRKLERHAEDGTNVMNIKRFVLQYSYVRDDTKHKYKRFDDLKNDIIKIERKIKANN